MLGAFRSLCRAAIRIADPVHVKLYAVGRMRGPGWQVLADDYLERIRHYVRCDIVEFKNDAELLRHLPKDDLIVALEVKGSSISSQSLAQKLESWGSKGKGRIGFIIGGTDGIPPQCSSQAHYQLSLSSLTLPHRLARVIMLEQIYRAMTILKAEPYARES